MSHFVLRIVLLFASLSFVYSCPPNSYDSQLDGCVYLQASAPFDLAEQSCNQKGGHLVSIHNAFDNTDVSNIGNAAGYQRFFLGARRYATNQTFMNSDGSPFNYQVWGAGQPLSDFCIAMQPQTQQWYTADCDQTLPSICLVKQAPTVPPASQCQFGWSYFAGSGACYYKGTGNFSFYDAQSICQGMSSNLASIHSIDENNFLIGLTLGYSGSSCSTTWANWYVVWIGGVYNHDWQWSDGSPFDYKRLYGHSDPDSGSLSLTSETGCSDFTQWRVRAPAKMLPYFVCKKYPGL
ncbi:unnamed protein product, partial [Mesorhabditis belari]|uniref:C-type lectin domain-containing protein n=1 Tax=Mesorhabditis belari TaxID=2138241 RepID=A0AAF3FU66_9BILA